MRNVFFAALISFFPNVYAMAATSGDLSGPCSGFAAIAKNAATLANAGSGNFDEIAEIARWTDAIKKLQMRTGQSFWSGTPEARENAIRASAEAGEISHRLRDELSTVLKNIEDTSDKEEIYRILKLPDERAVSTALRLGLHTGGVGNQHQYLPARLEQIVATRCTPPVSRQCETDALAYLVGSDRRAIEAKDLAQKLGPGATDNFQVVEATRLTKADADLVAGYLKNVGEMKLDGANKLVVQHEQRLPPPVALQNYIEQLQASLKAADPEAKIEKIEVIHIFKGEARNPYTHFDGGPGIQVLTTFEGSRSWMQGADGRFFQISELGDSVLFLTNQTAHPAAHLSPADFETERVVIRILASSPKYKAKRN